jgi:hypothetical protein
VTGRNDIDWLENLERVKKNKILSSTKVKKLSKKQTKPLPYKTVHYEITIDIGSNRNLK